MGESPRRYPFSHRQRLHGSRAFAAVFDAQMRKNLGVIGLSVPRRVGGAVVRVRIKRRLREAFRLGQHDVPAGYDLVVVVRPHEALAVAEYQALLADGIARIHELALKRAGKQDGPA
jgi:ribonuclease P protein component